MISFSLSLVALILGYLLYGRFIERIVSPDNRVTPAVAKADGLDYIVLPNWKVFMIQFLNIAGTGPIFGAIMGAKFGPVAYLWIVLGCIFAGATHDYLSGMLSMRNDGASLPELIGKYLGKNTKSVMLVFTVLLLIMVGTVFVYSPAEILHTMGGDTMMWIVIIFCYYIIATMLPIDKIIGKVYPLFAFSLLFMAAALMVVLFAKWSVACALFPFALSWLLLTGFVSWFPLMIGKAWLMWAVLSAIAFSGVMACALVAGKELGDGSPKAGALVKAGKKLLVPVLISSLLAISALVVDMSVVVDAKRIGCAAILWVAFNVWFFGFTFSTLSFAPWDRIRSGSRRVKMGDKKKKPAKKKK